MRSCSSNSYSGNLNKIEFGLDQGDDGGSRVQTTKNEVTLNDLKRLTQTYENVTMKLSIVFIFYLLQSLIDLSSFAQ